MDERESSHLLIIDWIYKRISINFFIRNIQRHHNIFRSNEVDSYFGKIGIDTFKIFFIHPDILFAFDLKITKQKLLIRQVNQYFGINIVYSFSGFSVAILFWNRNSFLSRVIIFCSGLNLYKIFCFWCND